MRKIREWWEDRRTPWGRGKDARLFLAAWFGRYFDALPLLHRPWLGRRANPNVWFYTSDGDKTAMHIAARFGDLRMVELLVKHGGELNASTAGGVTPLHEAKNQGHSDVVDYLQSIGGYGVLACETCGGIRCKACSLVLRKCQCGVRLTYPVGEPRCAKCERNCASPDLEMMSTAEALRRNSRGG